LRILLEVSFARNCKGRPSEMQLLHDELGRPSFSRDEWLQRLAEEERTTVRAARRLTFQALVNSADYERR
jgi:hypothetical protein